MTNKTASRLLFLFALWLVLPLRSQVTQPTVDLFHSPGVKGYFLLSPFKMKKEGKKSKSKEVQLILNGKGEVMCYRFIETGSDFKMQANGKYSYWNKDKFYILDHHFKLCDSVACVNDVKTDSHDFIILPNGHYLLIGKETQTEDYSNKKLFKNKTLNGSKKTAVKYDVIQELDPSKKLIFQWSSRAFFTPEEADPFFFNDTASMDVTHFNSVDVDPQGNLLISSRYFHQVLKVKRANGEIMWRMGGIRGDIKILNDSLPFFGQHDARYTSDGRITLFDNGYGSDSLRHNARALEYEIDERRKTARLTWSYQPDKKIISDAAGNVNRKKKVTLINYGNIEGINAPNITFELVDDNRNLLERVHFTDTCASYRTFFYPKLSFKLKSPSLKCIQRNGKTFLTTGKKYKHYQWSTGEQTAEVEVRKGIVYYTFVSDDGRLYTRSKIKRT